MSAFVNNFIEGTAAS
jgi:hypothetical protein